MDEAMHKVPGWWEAGPGMMLPGLKSHVSSPGGSAWPRAHPPGVVGGLHDVDPPQSHLESQKSEQMHPPGEWFHISLNWSLLWHHMEGPREAELQHLPPWGGAQCQPSTPVREGQQPHTPHVGPGEQHRGARFPSVHDGVVEAGPGGNHKCLTQGVFIQV